MAEFTDRVFAAVRKIPRGRVASYGTVAAVAGFPRAARQVGMVMRLGRGLPWWRVLGADGRIVIADPQWKMEQAMRLQAEGVEVHAMKVDMERFSWRPRSLATAKRVKAAAKASPARCARSPRSPSRRPPSTSSRKRR